MVGTLVMAPKSVTFRRHDHLVSVLQFGDLLSHSYNITFSMFLDLVILSFAGKASVKRKGLQTLRPSHHAVSARDLMLRTIRGKPYMCRPNCILCNAKRSW